MLMVYTGGVLRGAEERVVERFEDKPIRQLILSLLPWGSVLLGEF